MDTKKLRQKILDLAIHGKLVPQDPNDEPASVLLERIRAEKEKLIKEGKIKAPKKSKSAGDTSHYPKDVPFELPEGWCWTTIEDISNSILYGVNEPSKASGNYKLLRITDIQKGKVDWETVPFTDYDDKKAEQYLLSEGDILFARTGATVGKSYLASNAPSNAIYASYLIRVRYSNLMCPQYVKFFFESGYYWEQISSSSVGVGQPNVNGASLGKLIIPIPPVAEQIRVAKEANKLLCIIDDLDYKAESLENDIAAAKSKILDLAVHGRLVSQNPSDEPAIDLLKRINPDFRPSDNLHYEDGVSKGWLRCRICDAFEINPKVLGNNDDECAFIPMALVPGGYSNELKFEIKRWETIKNGFSRFSDGDIGVAKISPCLENRKSVVFRDLPSGRGAGTTELIIFRPILVTSEYGLLFFKSQEFIANCKGTYSGVVGQQRVDMSAIRGMYINIPPIPEQRKIVRTVELIFNYLDIIPRCNEI